MWLSCCLSKPHTHTPAMPGEQDHLLLLRGQLTQGCCHGTQHTHIHRVRPSALEVAVVGFQLLLQEAYLLVPLRQALGEGDHDVSLLGQQRLVAVHLQIGPCTLGCRSGRCMPLPPQTALRVSITLCVSPPALCSSLASQHSVKWLSAGQWSTLQGTDASGCRCQLHATDHAAQRSAGEGRAAAPGPSLPQHPGAPFQAPSAGPRTRCVSACAPWPAASCMRHPTCKHGHFKYAALSGLSHRLDSSTTTDSRRQAADAQDCRAQHFEQAGPSHKTSGS